MTSSFTKKISIEQAELDRLQQRQLRDYLPELQAMARLQNEIRDIMARKKLSAEKRLNLISDLQIWFDKLKKKLVCWPAPYELKPILRLHQPCRLRF